MEIFLCIGDLSALDKAELVRAEKNLYYNGLLNKFILWHICIYFCI